MAEGGLAAEVTAYGLCGIAAGQMLTGAEEKENADICGRAGPGLGDLARPAKEDRQSPDLVLIMAGTNDLGHTAASGELILASLQGLHRICHKRGVPTVALAIPDAGGPTVKRLGQRYVDRRKLVNTGLAAWVTETGGYRSSGPELGDEDADGEVPSLDAILAALDRDETESEAAPPSGARGIGPELFVNTVALLPFGPRSRAAGLWERDGVHFTAEGSMALGRRIAAELRPLVARLRRERLTSHTSEQAAGGDGNVPSLDAFLAAFDAEDEAEDEHAGQGPQEHAPAAAVVLQRAWRRRARRD